MKKSRNAKQWQLLAQKELIRLLARASRIAPLKRLGPKAKWSAQVSLCGLAKMTTLNLKYRKKRGPTDVLSFESPLVFRRTGILGEVVICLPVLKKQARELGHSSELELRVLISHGVLHLLGLDHEKSTHEAKKMAALEGKLLGSPKGLIHRAH